MYSTLIVKTSYSHLYLKSQENLIVREIKRLPGLTRVEMAFGYKNVATDFEITVWFLNGQAIDKKVLSTKIFPILRNNLGDLIVSIE